MGSLSGIHHAASSRHPDPDCAMNPEPVDPSLFWRQAAQIFEFLSRCSIKTRERFMDKDLTGELF
jgi:hypothetical protein